MSQPADHTANDFHAVLARTAGAGLVVELPQGQIVAANPAAAAVTDYTTSQLCDLSLPELVGEDERSALATALEGAVEIPEAFRHQAALIGRNDNSALTVLEVSPLQLAGGPAAFVFIEPVAADDDGTATPGPSPIGTGELDHLGKHIDHLISCIESVLSAMPAGVLVVNEQLRVIHANSNPYWRDGLSASQAIGRDFREVVPQPIGEGEDLRNALLSVLHEGHSVSWLAQHSRSLSGWGQIFDVRIEPCVDSDGGAAATMVFSEITEQRRRLYELMILRQVARALLEELELPKLLHAILTSVTAGGAVGLGFNRAILLLVNKEENALVGEMGVGPENMEQAMEIWQEVAEDYVTLQDFLAEYEKLPPTESPQLQELVEQLTFDLSNVDQLPISSLDGRRSSHVTDAEGDDRVPDRLHELLGTDEFVVAPLVAGEKVIGAILADNKFTNHAISGNSVQLLTVLANLAALAIDRANTYQRTRQQAEQLDQAFHELQAAQKERLRNAKLAAIGEIAAIVAHEIRSPLSAVGGFAQRIARAPEDTEQSRKNARIIFQEVKRLEGILGELLDFSKPSMPQLGPLDVPAIVRSAAEKARHSDASQQIEITQQIDDDLPQVLADERQMEQVLHNLVTNALEAIEGPTGRVTIGATSNGESVQLYVDDTGQGIPEARLDQIFETFYSTKATGTGLGLALCKKLVAQHDGQLDVTSTPGKGARFTVSLPTVRLPVEAEPEP